MLLAIKFADKAKRKDLNTNSKQINVFTCEINSRTSLLKLTRFFQLAYFVNLSNGPRRKINVDC